MQNVVGIDNQYDYADFEFNVGGGRPDVILREARTVIEQKKLGTNLDEKQPRRGKMVTAFEQALAYASDNSIPQSEQARYIVVSNFETFRIYDRETPHFEREYLEISLSDLENQITCFDFITDPNNSLSVVQGTATIRAGEMVGVLYEALKKEYLDPDSSRASEALNVLCVRLVFCMFAEDSGLFEKGNQFENFIRHLPCSDIRQKLHRLFSALNTPIEERDYYDTDTNNFPYVNGGLFKGKFEIPNFTEDLKETLVKLASEIDWSDINPTIFGGVFESTLNPETRRDGGMHYTSVENIHKVIDVLFLDELKHELNELLKSRPSKRATKISNLLKYRDKLAQLKFLDPACGSGNFLTETYICLRKLENRVLGEIYKGQSVMGFEDITDIKVSISQFYGI